MARSDTTGSGAVASRSRNGQGGASCCNRWGSMPIPFGLGTCLAAKLGDGLVSELVAGSEVVDEFVLACKALVAVAVDTVVFRSGLCCDVSVQGGQPDELGGASAQECLMALLGSMLLQGVVVRGRLLAGRAGVSGVE